VLDNGSVGSAVPSVGGGTKLSQNREKAAQESFEAFFRDHYRRLVRSLSVASGDQDLATEVVQQAFVQLWVEWPRISRYESPASWVARVAISRLRDQRRSLRRLASALVRLQGQTRTSYPLGETDLDLAEALARLPLRQRLAVVLYYLDDRSTAEIARAMGVAEGTVNRHLFRAREALRAYLQEA
jgi:RNA polymerase sigma-70 factor (ECF subfamily)